MSSLREKLKALEELQRIDLEANEVKAELEKLPARKAEAEAKVLEARRAWDDEKQKLESNERERRQIESLLGMERDKVKKWEGRLGEIRTPREYSALSREIEIAKKANDGQSEHVKELTGQAVELQKSLETRAEALAEREEAAQGDLAAIEQARTAAEQRLGALETARAAAAGLVDPSLLSKYENIKRRRAGVAVTPVIGMTCKGCQRNIPPQLAIILARANSIETCPNCNRIIYSADAVNPATPPPV